MASSSATKSLPAVELPDQVEFGQANGVRWFLGLTGALLVALGGLAGWHLATEPLPADRWDIALGPLMVPLGGLMLVSAMRRSRNRVMLDREGFTILHVGRTRRVRWRDVEHL